MIDVLFRMHKNIPNVSQKLANRPQRKLSRLSCRKEGLYFCNTAPLFGNLNPEALAQPISQLLAHVRYTLKNWFCSLFLLSTCCTLTAHELITPSALQEICDHIIDKQTKSWDPSRVQKGDLVYVEIDRVGWFFTNFHNAIPHPYVLVSGGSGDWVPRQGSEIMDFLYDPKLAAWFCKTMILSHHPKLFQLPIGPDYTFWVGPDTRKNNEELLRYIDGREKKHLLYMNHFPRETPGERKRIVQMFENAPYCFSRNCSTAEWSPVPLSQYLEDLASSTFVLSPLGWEYDCVRTWEALAVNTIPIVEHLFVDPVYDGLPVVMVHDWDEISPSFLNEKYALLKNCSREKAFFSYWRKQICKIQDAVKTNANFFSELEATQFNLTDIHDLCSLLKESSHLIYFGHLTGARPLQLAKECPWLQIDVLDHWLNASVFAQICRHIADPSLLEAQQKIHLLNFIDHCDHTGHKFLPFLTNIPGDFTLFLDLTYYRHGAVVNFEQDFRNPRKKLERSLLSLWNALPLFSTLCGTDAQDAYVAEVLERVVKQSSMPLEKKGNFWFASKTLSE